MCYELSGISSKESDEARRVRRFSMIRSLCSGPSRTPSCPPIARSESIGPRMRAPEDARVPESCHLRAGAASYGGAGSGSRPSWVQMVRVGSMVFIV